MDKVQVLIKRFDNAKGLDLPVYATKHAAGMDLFAAIDAQMVLKPGERALIPTGYAIAIPEGYEVQIRPRSGLAYKNGVTVLNTPGTIDADFRGEMKVILINLGQEDFKIERGLRIAQMVLAKYSTCEYVELAELPETERGAGCFGSTGIHHDVNKK